MFAGKAGAYPRVEHLKGGLRLTRKHYIRLEMLAREKRSSLLRKVITYGRTKFYIIGLKLGHTNWLAKARCDRQELAIQIKTLFRLKT
jgi:hypothetical protein